MRDIENHRRRAAIGGATSPCGSGARWSAAVDTLTSLRVSNGDQRPRAGFLTPKLRTADPHAENRGNHAISVVNESLPLTLSLYCACRTSGAGRIDKRGLQTNPEPVLSDDIYSVLARL